MLLPINPVDRIAIFLINNLPNRRIVFGRTHLLHTLRQHIRSAVFPKDSSKKDSHNAPHTS